MHGAKVGRGRTARWALRIALVAGAALVAVQLGGASRARAQVVIREIPYTPSGSGGVVPVQEAAPGTVVVTVPPPQTTVAATTAPQPQYVPVYGQPQPMAQPLQPEVRTRPNLGLIISGAVMLGVGWLANFVVGLPAGDDPFESGETPEWDAFRFSSLVPIAGPWIQLAVKPTAFGQDYWAVFLIVDGLLQAAGTVMLVVGIATPSTVTGYADLGGGVELSVLPSVGRDHAGLSASLRF